jgi:hypothetical protein
MRSTTLNAQHKRQVNFCVGALHQLCTTIDGLQISAGAAHMRSDTLKAQHTRQVNFCVCALHELCTTIDGLQHNNSRIKDK